MHSNGKGQATGNQDPGTSTHDSILDAALKVFAEKGYRGATTRLIAQEADVNEVTLFRHFGSKEGLLRALARREVAAQKFAAFDILDAYPKRDPTDILTELGTTILENVEKNIPNLKVLITVVPQSGIKGVSRWVPWKGIQHLSKFFGELGATDPYLTAVAFQSFIMRSIFFRVLMGEDPLLKPGEENIRSFSKIILAGMKQGQKEDIPQEGR